jgi:hypothetical protein
MNIKKGVAFLKVRARDAQISFLEMQMGRLFTLSPNRKSASAY